MLISIEHGIEQYALPAMWASALVSNDWSGLSKEEAAELRTWLETNEPGRCLQIAGLPFFAKSHDAQGVLATDCCIYDFLPGKQAS